MKKKKVKSQKHSAASSIRTGWPDAHVATVQRKYY